MSNRKPRGGCIGAGVLGSAIMRRLIDRGFQTLLWNRDRTKLVPIWELGAAEAQSPVELARDSELVGTCVSDGNVLEKVVFGEQGLGEGGSAGKVLVDMSTCAVAQTREMAIRLAQQCGMAWLDAPIS